MQKLSNCCTAPMDEERNICLSCKEPCSVEVQDHQKFTILVEETLSTTVEVKADTSDEAVMKVEEMYSNQEIVLDAGAFIGEPTIKDMNVE